MIRIGALVVAGVLGVLLGRSSGRVVPTDIVAVNHVGLATNDIDRSIRFYRDLFGMKLEGPIIAVDDDPQYNHIFGFPKVKARGASLSLGAMELEIWQFDSPRGRDAPKVPPVNDVGINHICFQVTNLDSVYRRLRSAGVEFHYPPQDFHGPKAVYGRDPDGNVFELIELPSK
jgi:catechol 2,3-dioxygenase-like lactoylglutathione lyase family enzyme